MGIASVNRFLGEIIHLKKKKIELPMVCFVQHSWYQGDLSKEIV